MSIPARTARWLGLALGISALGIPAAYPLETVTLPGDAGATLVYSTYAGGSGFDYGYGIAMDEAGRAYVTGATQSRDFPYLTAHERPDPAFLLALDATGRFRHVEFMGGPGYSWGKAVAVDSSGVYVAWESRKDEHSSLYIQKSPRSPADPIWPWINFVLDDYLLFANDLAVDPAHNVYTTGFAMTCRYDEDGRLRCSAQRAFVIKLDSRGSLLYSTAIDGPGYDVGYGIAGDRVGNAYVIATGGLFKLDPSGQTVDSWDLGSCSPADLVATRTGEVFLACSDRLIRLDQEGLADAASGSGKTSSSFETARRAAFDETGSYLYRAAASSGCRGYEITRLHLATRASVSACFPATAEIEDFAADRFGNVYITGTTQPGQIPVVNALQPVPGGLTDAFIAKIAFNQPPDCAAAFASPATIWPPDGRLVPIAVRNVNDPDGDPVAITVTGVRQDEPLQGAINAFGIGTPNVSIRAERDGKGNGRIYRLSFTAADPSDGTCTGTVAVCVPHDQGQGKACGDGGAIYNSAQH